MAKKALALAAACLLLLSLLSGCSQPGEDDIIIDEELLDAMNAYETVAPTLQSDGKFTLNYSSQHSFNPLTGTNAANLLVSRLMYETIFELRADFSWSSRLIKSYETEDYKMWRLYVDNEVLFSDGTPVTAADVTYSIQRAMQSAQYSARLSCVYGISAMDESFVLINLAYADAMFPALLDIPVIPKGSVGERVPLGTGLYVLAEEEGRLLPNENHPDADKLPLDTVYLAQYNRIEDYITAFENGDVDLVINDPSGIMNLGFSGLNESRPFHTTNMHYLGFNMNSGFFRYIAHRGAVNYAIDREYIAATVLGGSAVATQLPIHPSSPLYNPSLARHFYFDKETCARILDNLNVTDADDDGVREYIAAGSTMKVVIDFIVCSDNVTKVSAAKKITEDLRSVGLPVTLRELRWSDYVKALEEGEFDLYYGEVKLTADFNLKPLLAENGALNYGGLSDLNYANAITAYLSASDEDRQMYSDIMCAYILENAPILPLAFEKNSLLTHRNVVAGSSPTQHNVFYNFTDWTVNLGSESVF